MSLNSKILKLIVWGLNGLLQLCLGIKILLLYYIVFEVFQIYFSSRSFRGYKNDRTLLPKNFKFDQSSTSFICPFIDMFNHDTFFNAVYRWNEDFTSFEVSSWNFVIKVTYKYFRFTQNTIFLVEKKFLCLTVQQKVITVFWRFTVFA